MFTEKPILPSSNNLHLPAIGQNRRRRIRPAPTILFTSEEAKTSDIAQNISALKAKYADYNVWLKTSNRPNHEPILTQGLLKRSLCQMGIDINKAEQLVSTCSWYVYQFEKDLKLGSEKMYAMNKKPLIPKKNKLKKIMTMPNNTEDSITTTDSLDIDDFSCRRQRLLPSISLLNLSSSQSRRVDFEDEQTKYSTPKAPITKQIRLKPIPIDPSNCSPASSLNSSSSSSSSSLSRTLRRRCLPVLAQTRSILRKNHSISSSTTLTDLSQSKIDSNVSSTIIDEIPLGTRSQRLFGGSEYFVQIMNELEERQN